MDARKLGDGDGAEVPICGDLRRIHCAWGLWRYLKIKKNEKQRDRQHCTMQSDTSTESDSNCRGRDVVFSGEVCGGLVTTVTVPLQSHA